MAVFRKLVSIPIVFTMSAFSHRIQAYISKISHIDGWCILFKSDIAKPYSKYSNPHYLPCLQPYDRNG